MRGGTRCSASPLSSGVTPHVVHATGCLLVTLKASVLAGEHLDKRAFKGMTYLIFYHISLTYSVMH